MADLLKGKCAVITGSTSGIGQGIAELFAREGANVVLNGFGDKAAIESLRARIETEAKVQVVYHPADMSKPAEIAQLMEAAASRFAAIEDFPPEKWDAIIAINLTSAFHTTRLALRAMKARKWGRIINIASAHGLVASPLKSAYVASKHGIVGLTKTVALEAAEHGVTCNAICPGFVHTPLVEVQIGDRARELGISKEQAARDVILAPQPTKQFVKIEDIAALALHLAGPHSAQINGASLSVDGGWTAR
jgi:3-hydroxybutyrate dehydrogenase